MNKKIVSSIETRWFTKTRNPLSVRKVLNQLEQAGFDKKLSALPNLTPIVLLAKEFGTRAIFQKLPQTVKSANLLLTKKDRAGLSYKYTANFLGVNWRGIHSSISSERRGFSYNDVVKERLTILSPSLLNVEKLNNASKNNTK